MGYLISALVVALVAVIFALQNIEPVYVKFLFWNVQAPLAVALLAAFVLGVAATFLGLLAGKVKGRFSHAGSGKTSAKSDKPVP